MFATKIRSACYDFRFILPVRFHLLTGRWAAIAVVLSFDDAHTLIERNKVSVVIWIVSSLLGLNRVSCVRIEREDVLAEIFPDISFIQALVIDKQT